ncbi:Fic/DOC family protein [Nocardia aurantia]|uniref:protein adenylyltransferase n=1 Tax=Nocardia aurantia TaxID=2585199 RepID=A0A7K0DYK2_9NOCA|nr:Fic family protein [Nocardia aurantia]MQY30889.1 Adenosine monophosphate-protein transferase VbhT [Nocardia aurantia]
MSADPYVDPQTGLLTNLLGIIEQEELARAEAHLTTLALYRLDRRGLPGKYDLDHFCAFHRAIFGDIYAWAGQLRTVTIAKGDIFCLPQFIESFGADIFARLAREGVLRGLGREPFLDRLTYYFGEVNALHPFREGNGRTQRAFWGQLAREAGHPIRWQRLERERNLEASIASMRGDPEPLRKLLAELTE